MAWPRRLLNLVRSGRLARDIDRELAFHLAERTDELVASGMSEAEAAREARLRFGNYTRQQERTRAADVLVGLEALTADLRYAGRALRQSPGFTLVAVLSLALGLGANAALFSIVKTVLLKPLPYPDADRLVTISRSPWTPALIALDLRRSAHSFDDVAGFYPQPFAVTGAEEPYELEGAQVTPNFFRLFRARMDQGRDFVEADARPGAPRTAIISHRVWRTRYGGLRDVIGRTVRIDGAPHEIVGVLEQGFRQFAPRCSNGASCGRDPGLWIPFAIEPTRPDGSMAWVIPLARLNAGVELRQAQSELDVATSRFKRLHPHAEAIGPQWNPRLATIKSELVRNVRPALLLLQLAVGVVLLIACVNVASLLLARFSSRQREVAIRSAVGASKGRLLRQLLAESVVLSVLGGVAGLLLMQLVLKLVLAVAPPDVPRIAEVSTDASVFLFMLAVSIVTGLLFGTIPAVIATRRGLHDLLKEGGRTPARSRRQHRVSQALVIAEVSLTLVLLVGAGLLVRSFMSLTGQAPGFRTANVLTVRMRVPENRYASVPRLDGFYHQVVERLRRIPGVESAALSNNIPIDRGRSIRDYVVEGEGGAELRGAQYGVVSPGYFRTLDIPLVRGRDFDDADRRGATRVAIIDEAMWRDTWPGEDPIGKRFRFDDGEDAWLTVVGVVANTRGSGLASDPRPGFYISYEQRPATPVELAMGHDAVLLVSSRAGVERLSAPLRAGIWEVDPRQPVPEVATLESLVSEGVSPQRFRAVLLGAFAALALVLVITGVYGVIAYLVAERTHEFGIRMAMGATNGAILGRVLTWGLRLTAVGVAVGLIGAVVVNRYLASLLFDVAPTDPFTMLASVAAMVVVTVMACVVPARRATRVDPVIALRSERQPMKPVAR